MFPIGERLEEAGGHFCWGVSHVVRDVFASGPPGVASNCGSRPGAPHSVECGSQATRAAGPHVRPQDELIRSGRGRRRRRPAARLFSEMYGQEAGRVAAPLFAAPAIRRGNLDGKLGAQAGRYSRSGSSPQLCRAWSRLVFLKCIPRCAHRDLIPAEPVPTLGSVSAFPRRRARVESSRSKSKSESSARRSSSLHLPRAFSSRNRC